MMGDPTSQSPDPVSLDGSGPSSLSSELKRTSITRLSLSDFRNYITVDQRFDDRSVVLYGPNGAGKTNLLEAISLLGPGRGMRRAVFADVSREAISAPGQMLGEDELGSDEKLPLSTGGWAVAAGATGALGEVRLGTGLIAPQGGAMGPGPRQCRIDGANVKSASAFADHLRITWLTPAQDRLFTGPASDRRRFLDRLVSTIDPSHGRTLQAFEQAMKERNRLLEERNSDPAWLSAIEAQMAAAAVAVAAGRSDAVTRLQELLHGRSEHSAFPSALVELKGSLEASLREIPAVDAEDDYAQNLSVQRGRDRAAGRALDGPHRSDLEVFHGITGAPAGRCSTGEQKALLIAIILAETRLIGADFGGFAPILLLDEVAAHLDGRRRVALFEEIEALGAQAWMTGTDRLLFEALSGNATFVSVQGGQLAAEG